MCGGPEHIKPKSSSPENSSHKTMENNHHQNNNNNNHLDVETDGSFASSLLELAANNDLYGFKESLDQNPLAVDDIGLWYGRKKGCNQMVLQHRTPLMVAATYGSLDVLNLILSVSEADVNRCCGEDKATALHCAAAGGSVSAVDVVKALLLAGANPNVEDVNGFRPGDLIVVSPRLVDVKVALAELLGKSCVNGAGNGSNHVSLCVSTAKTGACSNSLDDGGSPNSNSTSSPVISTSSAAPDKKEYPIDPSLPDIKNSIFGTDEFRIFSFKVRPCSRAYSHDWTECPFVHPGENARRRDPRKFHYSCVPCPDFRKGACRRGDLCEYAHGVFECWLHPAQYRTRLCKDGTGCNRRVCFFAHTSDELRPLYTSSVPSLRSSASAAMEMAAVMGLMPGSPSSFTPPTSPVANGLSHSALNWPQPNVPTLHLPGNHLQSSRLRTSLCARDMQVDEYSMMQDFEAQQLMNDLCLSRLGSASAGNRGTPRSMTLTPSNLDDLFSAEISSSPRYNYSEQGAMFSPSHKTAILNQFQQQHQTLLPPINTNLFSPQAVETNALFQGSRGISSPAHMSPRSVEPISPVSSRLAAIARRENQRQTLRSLSSRELGSNVPVIVGSSVNSSWATWGSPSGALDWVVNGEELGRLRRSSSFELRFGSEEPDLSWVHSLVKESPPEKLVSAATASAATAPVESAKGVGSSLNSQIDEEQAAALGWK